MYINSINDFKVIVTREAGNTRHINCKLQIPFNVLEEDKRDNETNTITANDKHENINTIGKLCSCATNTSELKVNETSTAPEVSTNKMYFTFTIYDEAANEVSLERHSCASSNKTICEYKTTEETTEVNKYNVEVQNGKLNGKCTPCSANSYLRSHVRNDIILPNTFHLMSEVIVDNTEQVIAAAYREAVAEAKDRARVEYESTLNTRHKAGTKPHSRGNLIGSSGSRSSTPPSQQGREQQNTQFGKPSKTQTCSGADTSTALGEIEQRYIAAIPFLPPSSSSSSSSTASSTSHTNNRFMSFVTQLEHEACTMLFSTCKNKSNLIEVQTNHVNGAQVELSLLVWDGNFVPSSSTTLLSENSENVPHVIYDRRQLSKYGLSTLELKSLTKVHLHANGMLELFSRQSAGYRVLLSSDGSYLTSRCNTHLFVSGKDGKCTLHVNSKRRTIYELCIAEANNEEMSGNTLSGRTSQFEREDGVKFVMSKNEKEMIKAFFGQSIVLSKENVQELPTTTVLFGKSEPKELNSCKMLYSY